LSKGWERKASEPGKQKKRGYVAKGLLVKSQIHGPLFLKRGREIILK